MNNKQQNKIILSNSLENIHEITYENYFTKQGVEAFEKGLHNLREKRLKMEQQMNRDQTLIINLKIVI